MRLVALLATFAAETSGRIVFKDEWPSLFRVACDALAFQRVIVRLRILGWVRCMAVAARNFAFGHWVVCGTTEFRDRGSVARTTQGGFVRFQHRLGIKASDENRGPRILAISGVSQPIVRIGMYLVARNAADVSSGVRRSLPVAGRHGLLVATHTGGRRFFHAELGVRNNLGVLFCLVNSTGAVATLASLPINRSFGVGYEWSVWRGGKVLDDLRVAFTTRLLIHVIVRRSPRE